MSQEKYIGMDVHQATISVAVMDGRGKLIMECILETKAATILEFIRGFSRSCNQAAEVPSSKVSDKLPCNPRDSLAKFPESIGVVTIGKGTPQGWQTTQSKTSRANRGAHLQQWAGSRDKNLLVLRSRERFFLVISFYRTLCPLMYVKYSIER